MLTWNRFGTLGWRLASLAALLGALGLLLADSADDAPCPASGPVAGTYDAITSCGGAHFGRLTLVDDASSRDPDLRVLSGDLSLASVWRDCGTSKVVFAVRTGTATAANCSVDLAADLGKVVDCSGGCTLQLTAVPSLDQGVPRPETR